MTAPTYVTKTLSSITVQWLAPTDNGDSEVQRYVLYIKAEYESKYKEVYSGKSRSYTTNQLETGFNYQFKVRSVNAAGFSDFSAASSLIITALEPSTPLKLDLVSRSATDITFKWEPPLDFGGLQLSGYNVYIATGSGSFSEDLTAPSKTNPTILTHTASSLTAGQAYKFKVSATNTIGESLQTDYIYVIASDLPQQPVNPPIIDAITQTSITLTITAIPLGSNGGSTITGYIVQIDDGLGGEFSQVQDSMNLQMTISNLKRGRSYRIRYAGRNIVYDQNNLFECDSIRFSESALVVTAIDPFVPLNLRQNPTLKYKDQIVVQWDGPLDDGGSPLIYYTLSIYSVTASSETQVVLSSSAYDYTFTGLTPGYQYLIKIKSHNLVGESEWTDTISAYAGIEPVRPGLITYVSSTRNSLDISWSTLTGDDTGGTSANPIPITSYDLYMDNGYNGDFQLINSQATTSYTILYLNPGLMYRFRLKALNGIGLYSDFSTIQYMMAGTTPTSPG